VGTIASRKQLKHARKLNQELNEIPKDLKYIKVTKTIDNTTRQPQQQLNFFINTTNVIKQLSNVKLLVQTDEAKLNSLIDQGYFDVKSDSFMIKSLAELKINKEQFEIVAIVSRLGQILYWREAF